MSNELEARRREPKKPPFKFLVPLIYAPVLPLSTFLHLVPRFCRKNYHATGGFLCICYSWSILFVIAYVVVHLRHCAVRISLKRQPVLRDRLFGVVLAAALLHGGYLVTDLYDQESK